jgi:hypothetical protein
LMLRVLGYDQPGQSVIRHALALAGFGLLFLGGAWIAFSRTDADA